MEESQDTLLLTSDLVLVEGKTPDLVLGEGKTPDLVLGEGKTGFALIS